MRAGHKPNRKPVPPKAPAAQRSHALDALTLLTLSFENPTAIPGHHSVVMHGTGLACTLYASCYGTNELYSTR